MPTAVRPAAPAPSPAPGTRRALLLSAAAAALLAAPLAAQQDPPPGERSKHGIFVTVDNPITDVVCQQIEDRLRKELGGQRRPARVVVFDFNPAGLPAGTQKFGPCYELAQVIRRLHQDHPRVTTVAFVHDKVTNHTVLPAMACKELVTSSKGQIGGVLQGHKGGLSPAEEKAYEEVAALRASPSLVWKMVYADLVVRAATPAKGGLVYVDDNPARLKAATQRHGALQVGAVVPGLEAGEQNTLFDNEKARRLGLAKATYESRALLAQGYGVHPSAIREDSLAGRTEVAWRIDLTGTVDKAKLASLERRIQAAVGERHKANILLLYLDCEGGETTDVAETAKMLRNLKGKDEVRYVKTVAYVPPGRKLGAAAFLALGCSEIVMGRDSYLADFDYLKDARGTLEVTRTMLLKLAGEQNANGEALFRAALEPDVTLIKAQRDEGGDLIEGLLTAEQMAKQPGWKAVGRVPVPRGEFLKIDANLAHEWGVATHVNVNTPEELYRLYLKDPSRVRISRDDWLDKVAEFFREDVVKVFLIVIGIAGLILELKMPGIGIPGVVAALCFVLFFWAHSFVGQFTMLAIFLFVLGLVLIGIEVFVLPGFGVTGISGIALVVGSLVLVTLERMPETSADWYNLGATVTTFGVSLVAAILGAMVLAWYLPHIPYASRLVLQPPSESAEGGEGYGLGVGQVHAALLGAIGVAATTLRPAGKARFGDEYLDVVAEGTYVNPGSRVQVIEIEGNRVVVKEV